MKKTQLSKAITLALTGAALSLGVATEASATSTTMYNLYRANFAGYTDPFDVDSGAIFNATSTTPCAPCSNFNTDPVGPDNGTGNSTDGWVWAPNPNGPNNSDPFVLSSTTADPSRPGWVGIGGSTTPTQTTPFGYNAKVNLNWAVELNGAGSSAEISNADSIARYTQSADIDTAKGAWSDAANNPNQSGWKHDLEWGLFKTDVAGEVTLSIAGVNQSGTNFGFTIFSGISPNTTGSYSHHGGWNGTGNTFPGGAVSGNRNLVTGAEQLTSSSIPGQTGFAIGDIVAYSVADDPNTVAFDALRLNTITFNAAAGQVYSIALGGYRNGSWGDTNDGYVLNISQASPVPVPGAAWLFGGAIASLIGANRRKRVVPA